MNPVETVAVMAATLRKGGTDWEIAIEDAVKGLSMILYNEAPMLATLQQVAQDAEKTAPVSPILKPNLTLVKPH
ncbi:MAG: hypothetical protein E4G90_10330 [Gemmatimonadales bacterium]|nr:MAG: hypothetical protein E4G90_10330 [Gemmatimonadales bacterium]